MRQADDPASAGSSAADDLFSLISLFSQLGTGIVGRYLDLARAATSRPVDHHEMAGLYVVPDSDRGCEKSEISEISPARPDGVSRPIRRAVLLQAPEGAPVEWCQGVADLLAAAPHPAWTDKGWKTLQDDALAFLRQWAGQAHRLGWDGLDLFGAHPTAPVARMDAKGLVAMLGGRPVVAMAEDSAVIKATSGGTLTYRRHPCPPAGRCLVWDLARPVPMKVSLG